MGVDSLCSDCIISRYTLSLYIFFIVNNHTWPDNIGNQIFNLVVLVK